SRRQSLVDLLDKQKELGEDLKPIDVNFERAKRCKRALKEMHCDAIVVAKKLGSPIVE
ncbi:hypothetical protein A2U01_0059760, partial [Trifolium medium]|nr:hypothetical protein [Trifolium medium]